MTMTAVDVTTTRATPRALHHWHRYRWLGHNPFRTAGLYVCRCGVVRPGL